MKQSYKTTLLAITCIISFNINAGNNPKYPEGFKPKTTSAEQSRSISFTENKGQVCDQNYKPQTDVLFSGTDGELVYHLKNNGISYQLSRVDFWKTESAVFLKKETQLPNKISLYRLDITWLNSNIKTLVTTAHSVEGVSNYYLEQCPKGVLNVMSYQEITYHNLYKGIDLKCYSKNGHLEYDYIGVAGSDYKQIQLDIKGAKKLSISSKGELVMETPLGEIREQAPTVLQNGKQLKAKWSINNQTVSFEIDELDPNSAYIIDPLVRIWGTYYGSGSPDRSRTTKVDALGNVYIGGETSSAGSFMATSGSHQSTANLNGEAFLVKFNNAGVRQWATYYGGIGTDVIISCAVDPSNDVYAAGYSDSNIGTSIATSSSHQPSFGGGSQDAFLVKFNSSGVRQWATFYGGTGYDDAAGCATDLSGNVYISGTTGSNTGTNIASVGAHQTTVNGTYNDGYLVKFNGSGVRQWATYYGGNSVDYGKTCATDASGNVYLSGYTDSNSSTNEIATSGAHQTIFGAFGHVDAYLVKFNTAGVRQWGTYYGGSGDDLGYSCDTDASGNVFLVGSTGTATGSTISSAVGHQTLFSGGYYDGFVVKFSNGGVRQWGTYYGGNGLDEVYGCCTDALGNVFLSGYTNTSSGTTIATPSSQQSTYGGNLDAFIAAFNGGGTRLWGTYCGDVGSDYGFGCATDASGNVFLTGEAGSSTLIATPGSHQASFGGSLDAFLVKYADCTIPSDPVNTTTSVNLTICSGKTTTLNASSTGTISWYSTSTSTLALGTGTAFITPVQNNSGTFTFYAETFTCTNSASRAAITLTVNATPTVSVNNGSVCSGLTVIITPTGSSTYTITGGAFTVGPLANTSYSLTGTSSLGCVSSNTAVSTISVYANPTITVNSASICSGFNAVIVPSGANTYTINGSTFTVSPTANANYSITGTSTAGCVSSNTAVATISVFTTPTVSANSTSICSGASAVISPSGAANYTITGNTFTVNPLGSTNYSITGTSTVGCVSTSTAVSTVSVSPSPTLSVNSGSICSGNSFTITPGGASTYNYSSGNGTVNPSTTTSYSVTGTSSVGCVSSNTVVSTVSVSPSPTLSVNSGSICSGNSFTITPSGASTYNYSSGNGTVNPTTTTSYSVTGTSTVGCVSSNTAVSTVSVSPSPTLSVNSGSICSGNSFTITPSGASTYNYSSGNGTVNPTTTTSYSVTGTSSVGCVSSNTVVSTVSVSPSPTLAVNSGSICAGNSFTITPSGASTYTISGGTATVSPNTTSNYSVTGSNSVGCLSTNTVIATVTVNSLPTLTATSSSSLLCAGETATLSVSGANTYSWSNGISANTTTINPTITNSYTVTGTNTNGCSKTEIVTQNVSPCTGIEALIFNSQSLISLYPNPNKGEFTIQTTTSAEAQIINILGQVILNLELIEGKNNISLDKDANGIYLVRILQNGKLIKQDRIVKTE
jgi:hypothetical protein